MRSLRVLEGCCLSVGLRSRPAHPRGRSRVMGSVPAAGPTVAAVVTSLLERLQDNEGDRVQTYRQLERALQGGDVRLQSGVLNRLIAEASGDIRAAQGVTDDVRTAASDILVALAGSHFHFVMPELQGHLKAAGGTSEEFVYVTLGKLASSYALRCIPFAGMTLLALRAVLSRVGSGRIRRAVCGVLEQWLKGVKTYFCSWDKCPFPRVGEAQFCKHVYPLYCYVVQNWLGCEEEEDKQAVLGAVAAMIGVLLHEEQHREHAWDQLLLYQDTFWATKDWTMEEPWHSTVSQVFLGLVQLRKLKPSLSREESCKLLAECCHTILSFPSKEEMEGRGKITRQTQNIQTLHALCLEGLGRIIVALLEAEVTSTCFEDVVHVLQRWLASAKAWERERALQVCAQLLGDCEERFEVMKGCACKKFGFLVGLLGPLATESLATSRRWAGVCLGHLLQMQAKTRNVIPEAGDIACLRKGLDTTDDVPLLETSNVIAKIVCKYFPPAQAVDFMSTITESLKCTRDEHALAAGVWMTTFLEKCGQLIQEVPEVLHVLYSCMQTMEENTHRPLLLQAVYLLARFHHKPVVDSLLQKRLPMDRDAMELWRTLGRSSLGVQVLVYLTQKLEAVGENSPGPHSSAHELDHSQAALESLMLSCAISEVVFVLPAKERVRRLLPRLLPGLLGEISKALGEVMPLAPLRCQRGLFFGSPRTEDKPRNPYCEALELVLSRCMEKRWLLVLWRQGAWASLKKPQAHVDGVCLLTSVLLRNQLITRGVIWALSQWLNSPSENLQLTATAFFAELMKDPPIREKKFLESVLGILLEKSQHRISAVRQMAVRGLGNAFRGAPKEVHKHKTTILEVLQRGLENTRCPVLAAESMLALAEVVRKLKAKGLGSAFKDIARSTKMFFEAEPDVLRFSAFSLYAVLASSASGKRSFFTREVWETWVSLLLHLRDPDPEASNVCRTALYLCAPFLVPERVQETIVTSIGLGAAQLQYEVYHCLVKDAPAMSKRLHSIARSRRLENGRALHSAAIAVLGDILEKTRGLSFSWQQLE
ncbi:maestro heat-like repeat-containing protein family member 2B [Aquila chrysaetos chrysaetos]|uniref:maestro heat-like repeat-containing protein family member 2B n=1 Tax=Aquila chrysaetos chrysaetos TaxID=223781 RepID=UPI0011766EE0|nr:maestro heat-like repeat-containing protein family member 2B [Aquila chrysaetos chrysaetos]XP_040984537.1 maestro heat-like repeat-containing protein family member 2B [Aquila chrysaetos chrysaetos]